MLHVEESLVFMQKTLVGISPVCFYFPTRILFQFRV